MKLVQITVLINQRLCFRIYIHMITETSSFQLEVKSENYCIVIEKSLGIHTSVSVKRCNYEGRTDICAEVRGNYCSVRTT